MTEQNGSAAAPGAQDPAAPAGETAQSPERDGTDTRPAAAQDPNAAPAQPDRPDKPANGDGESGSGGPEERSGPAKLNELVDEPAKVMRIGTMIKQLLEEVRNAPLDDAARNRLAEIHDRSLKELYDGLAPELVTELQRINLPFLDNATPTDAELRIAQAQLVGWLEGLFRGIQTAIAAQQTANAQLQGRLQLRQLPPGTVLAPGVVVGDDGEPRRAATGAGQRPGPGSGTRIEPHAGPGQYL